METFAIKIRDRYFQEIKNNRINTAWQLFKAKLFMSGSSDLIELESILNQKEIKYQIVNIMVKVIDNKIGETVIFTKDLHCRFSVENVEQLKVYSLSKKQFDNCEDWSGDENNQCYKIADFNVEVYKDKTRFFYGEPVQYGFLRYNPEKLYFLPVGTIPTPKNFEIIGSSSFEEEYKVPGSMWDFGMFIDNFLFHVMGRRLELQNEHSLKRSEQRQLVEVDNNDGDDLPF